MKDIAILLSSNWFTQAAIPIITVIFSLFVKWVSTRNLKLEKNDWTIGFDLSVGALFAFLLHIANLGNSLLLASKSIDTDKILEQIVVAPFLLLLWIIGIWGLSTLIRAKGWETIRIGKSKIKKEVPTILVGIIVPIVFGLLSLWAVIALGVNK